MKRGLIISVMVLLCAGLLWAVGAQRATLAGLKRQQQNLLRQLAPEPVRSTFPIESDPAAVSPELLRLRNQVAQLSERKAELAGVEKENERLRAESQRADTSKVRLPPGYVRRSEARMVGFGSPDATVQTLLWALQNRDYDRFLQAFTPEAAEIMRARTGGSTNQLSQFHTAAQAIIGMGIAERVSNTDGSIQLKLQVLPNLPPGQARMVNVGGEWKFSEGL